MGSTSAGQLQHGMAVLRDQYSYLADVIVPEDILPEMFARKLITKSQKQKADSHLEKYHKNQVLLDSLLARREVGAFQKFCDALSATSGQEYIADKLKECKLTYCYVSKVALVSQIFVCSTCSKASSTFFSLGLLVCSSGRPAAPMCFNEHKPTKNGRTLGMRL